MYMNVTSLKPLHSDPNMRVKTKHETPTDCDGFCVIIQSPPFILVILLVTSPKILMNPISLYKNPGPVMTAWPLERLTETHSADSRRTWASADSNTIQGYLPIILTRDPGFCL